MIKSSLFFSILALTPISFFMFDFEKLEVYKKSKRFNSEVRSLIKSTNLDRSTSNQLMRASLSVCLNLAEGSGRFTKPDRRNFFVIARSSVFEVVAIIDILKDEGLINQTLFGELYSQAEEISKMIFALIKGLSN